MLRTRNLSCLFSIILFTVTGASAQNMAGTDTGILAEGIRNSVRQYQQFVSKAAPLYNGPQYVNYDRKIYEGHVFLYNPSFINGSVQYDGILYENIPLQYDLLRNVLVIKEQAPGTMSFTPDITRINYFTLGEHVFNKLPRDANNILLSGSRFYEVLYTGKNVTLLKKETKRVDEEMSAATGLRRTVVSGNDYFLKKGNTYYLFNKNRHVFEALRDRENEVRDFVRRQSEEDITDPDKKMIQIVTFYESLSK